MQVRNIKMIWSAPVPAPFLPLVEPPPRLATLRIPGFLPISPSPQGAENHDKTQKHRKEGVNGYIIYLYMDRSPVASKRGVWLRRLWGLAVRIINQCFSRCDTHLYVSSPTYVSAFCTDVVPCLLGMAQLRRRSVAGT